MINDKVAQHLNQGIPSDPQTVVFASGHKLEPNGMRDYNLVCPEKGMLGVVQHMTAQTINAHSVCYGCHQRMGERINVSESQDTSL